MDLGQNLIIGVFDTRTIMQCMYSHSSGRKGGVKSSSAAYVYYVTNNLTFSPILLDVVGFDSACTGFRVSLLSLVGPTINV